MGNRDWIAVVAAVVVLSLTGCGKDKKNDSEEPQTTARVDDKGIDDRGTDEASGKPATDPEPDKTPDPTTTETPDAAAEATDPPAEPVRKKTKCQDLKASAERAIAALDRRCESDDDCDRTGFGCPFGCSVAIRKGTKVGHVEKKAAKYHEQCGQCKYKCGDSEIGCVEKKCAILPRKPPKPIDIIDDTD